MRVREAARRCVTRGPPGRAAARRARSQLLGTSAPCAPNRSKLTPVVATPRLRGVSRGPRPARQLGEPIRDAGRPRSSAPAPPATTPGGYHSESPRRFVETPAPLTHSTRGYCAMAPARVKHIDGTTAHGRGFRDAVGSHDGGEVRAQGASRRRTRVPLSEARAGHLAVVVLEARGRTRARSPTPADIASQLPAAPRASTRPASRGPPTARPSMRRARFAQIAAPAPSQPLTHP
jgi:hypothetical protein